MLQTLKTIYFYDKSVGLYVQIAVFVTFVTHVLAKF